MDDDQKQQNSAEPNGTTPNDDSVAQAASMVDTPAQADAVAENTPDEISEPIPEPELAEQPTKSEKSADTVDADVAEEAADSDSDQVSEEEAPTPVVNDNPNAKWYVVHTFSGHENKVATNLKQRIESEHLENKIFDILVPTQDKIEIKGGKKGTVKEKIFPGYILVKMDLDDQAWLAVRTTQGVTAFVGMNNKPTPISEREVQSIIKFMTQGAPATFKDVFLVDDTVKIIDGPFTDFIGKVESVDKEKGKVRVLVSIFGRETPVELDFLQVTKL